MLIWIGAPLVSCMLLFSTFYVLAFVTGVVPMVILRGNRYNKDGFQVDGFMLCGNSGVASEVWVGTQSINSSTF